MTQGSTPTSSTTQAEQLRDKIFALDLDLPPEKMKKGWLRDAYLGGHFESVLDLPPRELTKLFTITFHSTGVYGAKLSVGEILDLLDDTEMLIPKHRA